MKKIPTQSPKQSSKSDPESNIDQTHIDQTQSDSEWTPDIPPILEPFDTHRARSKRRLVIAVLLALPYTLDFSRAVSEMMLDPSNAIYQLPEVIYLATVIVLIGYVPRFFGTKVAREILGRLLPHSESSAASTTLPTSIPTVTRMMSRASSAYLTEKFKSRDRLDSEDSDRHTPVDDHAPEKDPKANPCTARHVAHESECKHDQKRDQQHKAD